MTLCFINGIKSISNTNYFLINLNSPALMENSYLFEHFELKF